MSEKEQILQPLNKNFKEPKLRFLEFDKPYYCGKLHDVVIEITRKNNNYDYPIMMISASKGFINQSEKYSTDNAGTSKSKYIHLKKGELAYNHGNSKVKKYGAVFMLEHDNALVPFVYHCFSINKNQNSKYWAYYLNTIRHDRYLRKIVCSTARLDGLLNISSEDYFKMPVNYPELEEQSKITRFLDLLYRKIELIEAKINTLKKYKKGIKNTALKHIVLHGEKKNFLGMFDEYKEINKNNYPQYTVGKHGLIKIDDINYDLSKHSIFSERNLLIGIGIEEITVSIKDKGCVSPVYTVYSINESLNDNYFYWFLKDLLIIQKRSITKKSTRRKFEIDKKELNKCKISYVMDEFIKCSISTLITISLKIRNFEQQLFLIKNIKSKILKDMFI